MKKIRKEKLRLQKGTVVELNNSQMSTINGGSEYDSINANTEYSPQSGPRLTYTTCSSVKTTQ